MKNLRTYLLILLAGLLMIACQDDEPITSCSDGIQNGTEVGVDCGGDCAGCASVGCTDPTAHNYDPLAIVDDGSCENCSDGVMNGGETQIDCGGDCSPCAVFGCTNPDAHNFNPNADSDDGSCLTCTDGILNGDEIEVDCGGNLCDACLGVGQPGEAGGLIFYDKGNYSNGWRYLEVAPSDQAIDVRWAIPLNQFVGSTSVAIGAGYENCEIVFDHGIFVGAGMSIALGLSFGGKSDWYLPSRDELREIYFKRDIISELAADSYWSSSEYDANRAWTLDFVAESRIAIDKQTTARVRAIRRF